jgi:cation:H+ antiporter
MTIMDAMLIIAGLVLLVLGAEALVRGASRLAAVLGVSPLVIGLTVVAFGTSSPELAVGIKASLASQAGITMGNVVGSNLFNILFILGLSALIAPLAVSQQLIRLDVPLMIVLSLLVLLLAMDGMLGLFDGCLLFSALFAYIGLLVRVSRKECPNVKHEYEKAFGAGGKGSKDWIKNAVLVFGGLALLVLGSRWLVEGAVAMARDLAVGELVIGLTVVAAGTSLPELVTSVVASIRGERDIAVGNVVGSNLFNIMGVLGLSCIVAPGGIAVPPAVIRFDLPIMIVVATACLPIFFTGGMISRWEGVLLLGYYAAYTLYIFLAEAHHEALPLLSATMLYFAIPLTLAILSILALRSMRRKRNARTE